MCPWIHLKLQIPFTQFLSMSTISVFGSRLRKNIFEKDKRERKIKGNSIFVALACYCSALVSVQMESLVAF